MTNQDPTREELQADVTRHIENLESYFQHLQGNPDPKTFGTLCRHVENSVTEINLLPTLIAGSNNPYYSHLEKARNHIEVALRQADSIHAAAKRIEFGLSLTYHELGLMKAQLQIEISHGLA